MAPDSTEIPVDSSVIRSVTYGTDATLTVRLHNGAVYRYVTVPRTILDGLLAATSKGAFFNRHIRDGFLHQRLVDPTHASLAPRDATAPMPSQRTQKGGGDPNT